MNENTTTETTKDKPGAAVTVRSMVDPVFAAKAFEHMADHMRELRVMLAELISDPREQTAKDALLELISMEVDLEEARTYCLDAAEAAVQDLAAAVELLDASPANEQQEDPWVAPAVYLRAALPARAVNHACASGQIVGAVRKGKRWAAKRSAVDAYLSSQKQDAAGADAVVLRWSRRAAAGGSK